VCGREIAVLLDFPGVDALMISKGTSEAQTLSLTLIKKGCRLGYHPALPRVGLGIGVQLFNVHGSTSTSRLRWIGQRHLVRYDTTGFSDNAAI
jgi:hypothetical protein